MRLRLELCDGPQAGAARVSELLSPFVIGTRPGATWQIRGDEARDGEAMLSRNSNGTVTVEANGDVTLEGRPLSGSGPVPLGHGNIIVVAGRQVRLVLEANAATEGFGLEAPSISAILSDVAPGGDSARGPLPGWSEGSPLDTPSVHRPASEQFWQEPTAFSQPDTSLTPSAGPSLLPENWADEQGEVSDRSYQAAAPLGRANVNPLMPAEAPAPRASLPSAADVTPLLAAVGMTPADINLSADRQLTNAGAGLARSLAALERLEDQLLRQFAELDIAPPDAGDGTRFALHPAAVLSDRDGSGLDAVQRRVEAIALMQQALLDGFRKVIERASDQLDPTAIAAASANRRGMTERLMPAIGNWAEFEARLVPKDGVPLLSDTALAREIQAALGRTDQTEDKK